MYHITIHTTVEPQLFEEWQRLWEHSPLAHMHNSPQWFQVCHDGLKQKDSFLLTVRDDERLVVVFPLVKEKRFGINAICNIGRQYTDVSTLLLAEDKQELLDCVITKLMQMGNLYLGKFTPETTAALCMRYPQLAKQYASESYYLPLDPDPLAFMSGKNRNKLKKRLKDYRDHVSFSCYYDDPDGISAVFEVEKKSTKAKEGKASFLTPGEQYFLQSITQHFKENFLIGVLSYKGIPIAYGTGFVYKHTFQAFITAHEGSYRFLSPGKLLTFYLFEEVKKRQITLFDFSRGRNDFKRDFTPFFYINEDVLFATNPLILLWWRFCHWLYHIVLENKLLYGFYLLLKGLLRG